MSLSKEGSKMNTGAQRPREQGKTKPAGGRAIIERHTIGAYIMILPIS